MKITKARQIEVNVGKLDVMFGANGVSAPTPNQQTGFINDSIVVNPDGAETTVGTIILKTRMATAAFDMESDLESIEEALSGIDASIASAITRDGVAPIVLNGISLTSRLIRTLQQKENAEGNPEPVLAVFTSKAGCTYAINVQIEGSISLSERDDAEDEWAQVSAEVNCAGTALNGVDTLLPEAAAGPRVTKKIDGQTTGDLRQDVSFEFKGTVAGSGQELTVTVSLFRKAHTNGAGTISTVSAVYISNIQVHIREMVPKGGRPPKSEPRSTPGGDGGKAPRTGKKKR